MASEPRADFFRRGAFGKPAVLVSLAQELPGIVAKILGVGIPRPVARNPNVQRLVFGLVRPGHGSAMHFHAADAVAFRVHFSFHGPVRK